LIVGGAAAVIVIAAGAAIGVPKLLSSPDPGCKAYTGTALPSYNQAINDLNTKAPQAKLTSDLTASIGGLKAAADQARSATAKTALNGLLTQLTSVRVDMRKGSVPAKTVTALNSASTAADNAC
jgi:hypothetical protein